MTLIIITTANVIKGTISPKSVINLINKVSHIVFTPPVEEVIHISATLISDVYIAKSGPV